MTNAEAQDDAAKKNVFPKRNKVQMSFEDEEADMQPIPKRAIIT